jgi:hypothetical protein
MLRDKMYFNWSGGGKTDHVSILRSVKRRLFILLSLHQPNNRLENFFCSSSTQKPKNYSWVEKNIGGAFKLPPCTPEVSPMARID